MTFDTAHLLLTPLSDKELLWTLPPSEELTFYTVHEHLRSLERVLLVVQASVVDLVTKATQP